MWFIILLTCHIAIASAWKILLWSMRWKRLLAWIFHLLPLHWTLFHILFVHFHFFDPSVKISIFSWQFFFIVTLFVASIFILFFLFSIETGPILSVIRFGLILMNSFSIQSIFSSVVWYFFVLVLFSIPVSFCFESNSPFKSYWFKFIFQRQHVE